MLPPNGNKENITSSSRMKKGDLHESFSAAAIALTKLYQESNNAYEEGYRDALLYVYHYVFLTSHTLSPSGEEIPRTSPTNGALNSKEGSISSDSTIASEKLLNFIQKTLKMRKERLACARGTSEEEKEKEPCSSPLISSQVLLPPLIEPPAFLNNHHTYITPVEDKALGANDNNNNNNNNDNNNNNNKGECSLLKVREDHAYNIAEIDHTQFGRLKSFLPGKKNPCELEPPLSRVRYHSPVDYRRK